MALPKISQPTFTLTLPSNGKKVRYRPFTVKEEKILLFAKTSGETDDYINAFKQLITNCCLDPIDVDSLASFDIEYFFINLRAKSVSNVIDLVITDSHGKEVKVSTNLDNIKVHTPTVSNKVVLDSASDIGIKLKYPTFAEMSALIRRETGEVSLDDGLDMFLSLIDVIWEGEAVYVAKEATRQELVEFIDGFNAEQVKAVEAFLEDLPYVYLDVPYTDSEGKEQNRKVTGIDSFFV